MAVIYGTFPESVHLCHGIVDYTNIYTLVSTITGIIPEVLAHWKKLSVRIKHKEGCLISLVRSTTYSTLIVPSSLYACQWVRLRIGLNVSHK